MPAARKAGATGGTVIKGRLADIENIAIPENNNIDGEREILLILAPSDKYTGLRSKISGKLLVCF